MDTRMPVPIAQLETLFKALADTTRLRILGLLLTGEVCVCHIHESLRIPQSKASRHLAYLRSAGLVATRREGLWVYYRFADADAQLVQVIERAVRQVLSQVPEVRQDLGRLEQRTGCCLPGDPPALAERASARPATQRR